MKNPQQSTAPVFTPMRFAAISRAQKSIQPTAAFGLTYIIKGGPMKINNKGLAHIRKMRRIFLFILFSLFPIFVVTMISIERFKSWLPIILPVSLFFLGIFVQNRLHKQKCPNCNAFFFVQTVTRRNYTPASSISFPPQKKCQNCGVALYR